MTLASQRTLAEMKPVLKDPGASGPDPVYRVFNGLGGPKWVNKTIVASGRYNQEYPKTFGHYHSTPVPEIYHQISGIGILVLQKKHSDENIRKPEIIDEVFLVQPTPGDEITITPEWGHSWSNIGSEELALFDDWSSGHQPSDYEQIQALHGMAYYLTEENGQPKAVPNPHYQNLPPAQWLSAQEFAQRL